MEYVEDRIRELEDQLLNVNAVLAHMLKGSLVGKRTVVDAHKGWGTKAEGEIVDVTKDGVEVKFDPPATSAYYHKPPITEVTVTIAEAIEGLL